MKFVFLMIVWTWPYVRLQSARELSAVMWGQELAGALVQLDDMTGSSCDQGESPIQTKHLSVGSKMKNALRDVWKDAPTDVFDNA